eukprot:6662801-Prymnesium_polylepis.1
MSSGPPEILASSSVRVIRQPGDGSCLFHSLCHGLRDGSTANALRRQVRRARQRAALLRRCMRRVRRVRAASLSSALPAREARRPPRPPAPLLWLSAHGGRPARRCARSLSPTRASRSPTRRSRSGCCGTRA